MKNKIVNLKIEKIAHLGYGIGHHDGSTIFVRYAIPGDVVDAGPYGIKKGLIFADIIDIRSPSPARITPECKNYGTCGGCSYLCADYESELSYKKSIILDCMNRIGGVAEVDIPAIETISGPRYGYRSHAEIKTDGRCNGFYKREGNDLVPFPAEGCLLLHPSMRSGIDAGMIKTAGYRVAVDCAGRVLNSLSGPKTVEEKEGGIAYCRDIGLFFQANRHLRGRMLDIVGEYSSLASGDEFLDIGCGVGFFTLYLSKNGARGTGFDTNGKSIEWAERNADSNLIKTCRFVKLDSSDINPYGYHAGTVLADPPRSGLSKKTRNTILAINPRKIVYVSCNPATFARDTADFIKGGYDMDRLSMIDMFPATYHVEIVSRFVK